MKRKINDGDHRTYTGLSFESALENISQKELEKRQYKRQLAVKIEKAITINGLKRYEFAKKINKNNSEMDKWLSGQHNFTVETLIFLQNELAVDLLNLELNFEE